jgi:hypothetical protein
MQVSPFAINKNIYLNSETIFVLCCTCITSKLQRWSFTALDFVVDLMKVSFPCKRDKDDVQQVLLRVLFVAMGDVHAAPSTWCWWQLCSLLLGAAAAAASWQQTQAHQTNPCNDP